MLHSDGQVVFTQPNLSNKLAEWKDQKNWVSEETDDEAIESLQHKKVASLPYLASGGSDLSRLWV